MPSMPDKHKHKEEELARMVGGKATEEEYVLGLSLRPQTLKDFIGQKDSLTSLSIAIEAAQKRQEALEHILLSGPPGLGKTSLAYCVAKDLGARIVATSGPAIERAGDLIGILTNLDKGDILFIDEIHRVSKVVEEFLYPAMENFQIDFVIDKGPFAKTVKFNLKPFTLIGATTREGMLSEPLRSRFGIFLRFDFYQKEEICEVVRRSAKILDIEIEPAAVEEIACRSRGTPRLANRLLRRVRDYSQVKGDGKITSLNVKKALSFLKIDEKGLDEFDRRYLKVLIEFYRGGPSGIEAIAANMGESADTLMDVIEPYLMKLGFIQRSLRGRIALPPAYKHLGLAYKEER